MGVYNFDTIDNKVTDSYHAQLRSFLLDQKNVAISIGTLTSLGLTIFANNGGVVLPMISGAFLCSTGAFLKKAVIDTGNFAIEYRKELIRQTPEYQECMALYYGLIREIAELFDWLRVRSSLDIAHFYEEMLYNGYFSAPGKFNYHKYDKDKGVCPELYGARVTTGVGVCRHIATNLKDIYEALGFTAAYLSVGSLNDSLINNFVSKVFPRGINHAVVCVKDKFGKFIVDPTWEKIAVFENGDTFARIIGDDKVDRKYVVGYTTLIDRRRIINYDSYVGLRGTGSANLKVRDVNESIYCTKDLFSANIPFLRDFYAHIRSRLDRIASLEFLISGCVDEREEEQGKRLRRI